ncbi:hypothetical protein, conserved [Trypanosoma brucei brucei TREU927]|uniref:Uncharacterized protein n=1 Tax=Trypanosoma brucei brucei (strain 927/4 GUTat10.1) TaxID=185431 RepID=Q583X5_TRYB2|nr:hypothetical protein, conserved [Trypanosoma brucei brucei TREU927]AAX79822.1 hypothetical protein, conserved [Trypanosoma brucei]AAZ10889.1 hypothetical protein, conserved [Trypanosoma brucei brucei TREU927]
MFLLTFIVRVLAETAAYMYKHEIPSYLPSLHLYHLKDTIAVSAVFIRWCVSVAAEMGLVHSDSQPSAWSSHINWFKSFGFGASQDDDILGSPVSRGELQAAEQIQTEFTSLDHEAEYVNERLRRCEEALVAVLEKEKILSQGVEAIMMEMHDYTAAGGSEWSESDLERFRENQQSVDSVLKILEEIREKREHLQQRIFKTEVYSRLLEAERKEAEKTLDAVRRSVGDRTGYIAVEGGNESTLVIPPAPLVVSIVEEFRNEVVNEEPSSTLASLI